MKLSISGMLKGPSSCMTFRPGSCSADLVFFSISATTQYVATASHCV
jgi:hypothetical protein